MYAQVQTGGQTTTSRRRVGFVWDGDGGQGVLQGLSVEWMLLLPLVMCATPLPLSTSPYSVVTLPIPCLYSDCSMCTSTNETI